MSAPPGFGRADLSSCEREQIHLAASVQPFGALLLVREADQVIVQASANASAFLGADATPGRSLETLPGDLAARIDEQLAAPLDDMPAAISCRIGDPAAAFNGLLHRPPGGGVVVELERPGPPLDLLDGFQDMVRGILAAPSRQALCDETTRIFREVAGYDRVMLYTFDEEGHGQVVSEWRQPELEAFLGNRYPATDIPQIARRLYERNRVRILVDVGYQPVPLQPRLSPMTGEDLDMSLCVLRSVSPIHIQYLKNMGVRATLVASLVVGGRLWGLVSCHHYSPRLLSYPVRALCELLAETVAARIAALESFERGQAEIAVRRLEQSMIAAIARKGDWQAALLDSPRSILEPLDARGAALLFEGEVRTVGEVPGTLRLREIGAWLDRQPRTPVFATASFALDAPQFAGLTPVASGIVAACLSDEPGDYLVWFRPERVRTDTWGGNPFKSMVIGDNPLDLSPRRSFAQWHQLVEGTSDPWTEADLAAARLVAESVADVVLQFRAVRTIIAQDQLRQVRRQVAVAEQPVVIGDDQGRIVMTNGGFRRLLGNAAEPERISDLPRLFARPDEARERLGELLAQGRNWRGEVELIAPAASGTPLLIRADPVFGTGGRSLGFVLLFTDLTERKAAAEARVRFQEDLALGGRALPTPLNSRADLVFHSAISPIMENAQLAALEITDGAEPARIPQMLASVRSSVLRAARLLRGLVRQVEEK
jgi:light-regulated signal transduction histidine kinase (bacteriophytochrome)